MYYKRYQYVRFPPSVVWTPPPDEYYTSDCVHLVQTLLSSHSYKNKFIHTGILIRLKTEQKQFQWYPNCENIHKSNKNKINKIWFWKNLLYIFLSENPVRKIINILCKKKKIIFAHFVVGNTSRFELSLLLFIHLGMVKMIQLIAVYSLTLNDDPPPLTHQNTLKRCAVYGMEVWILSLNCCFFQFLKWLFNLFSLLGLLSI